jgi:lipoate-protein ligase A
VATWRLIIEEPADGAWNMAVDRAILEAHEAGVAAPTLRLYRWVRPTVSLGRFQDVADVDRAYCDEHAIGLCRRPTGGRGVLHDDELTYAIVAGVRDGIPRGVTASYRILCGALAAAYRSLGVPAELTSRPRGHRASGACYLHATPADLSFGAAKLSGSAQVWKGDSCLQHGSFVVSRDDVREAAVFGLETAESECLRATTATIEGVTGARPAIEAVASAVCSAVAEVLDVRLEPGELTACERERASGLRESFEVESRSTSGRNTGSV